MYGEKLPGFDDLLSEHTFKSAMQMRAGVPLTMLKDFVGKVCTSKNCNGRIIDAQGTHALCCRGIQGSRTRMHNLLRDCLADSLERQFGVGGIKREILFRDLDRPVLDIPQARADLSFTLDGRLYIVDVTIAHYDTIVGLSDATRFDGHHAEKVYADKLKKYGSSIKSNDVLLIVAVETNGRMAEGSVKSLLQLIRSAQAKNGMRKGRGKAIRSLQSNANQPEAAVASLRDLLIDLQFTLTTALGEHLSNAVHYFQNFAAFASVGDRNSSKTENHAELQTSKTIENTSNNPTDSTTSLTNSNESPSMVGAFAPGALVAE